MAIVRNRINVRASLAHSTVGALGLVDNSITLGNEVVGLAVDFIREERLESKLEAIERLSQYGIKKSTIDAKKALIVDDYSQHL